MNYEEFCVEFNSKLKKINIDLNSDQLKQFYDYMNLLIEWNNKINLTAIIEPKDIILKHFIDSLVVNKYIKQNDRIADIGTGAGFPGIPIKIANDSIEIDLVDSLNKRIIFLEEVIKSINLDKTNAIHMRAEEIGQNKKYRAQFDVVTSRAVAKLNVLVEYMLPLLKIGGRCICLKGPNVQDEINEAKNAIKILGGEIENVEELTLPDSDNKRTIIVIKLTKVVPSIYPRKPGTPADKPLL